jgi:hypothetical protein
VLAVPKPRPLTRPLDAHVTHTLRPLLIPVRLVTSVLRASSVAAFFHARSDGRLFHIDFAYILGNDPKPFPPPMKLCREMIEAMGGQGSDTYKQVIGNDECGRYKSTTASTVCSKRTSSVHW